MAFGNQGVAAERLDLRQTRESLVGINVHAMGVMGLLLMLNPT